MAEYRPVVLSKMADYGFEEVNDDWKKVKDPLGKSAMHPNQHLDSPIKIETYLCFNALWEGKISRFSRPVTQRAENLIGLTKFHYSHFDVLRDCTKAPSTDIAECWPALLSTWTSSSLYQEEWDQFLRCARIGLNNVTYQEGNEPNELLWPRLLEVISLTRLKALSDLRTIFSSLVKAMNAITINQAKWDNPPHINTIDSSIRTLVDGASRLFVSVCQAGAVVEYGESCTLFTREGLLMLSDLCHQRFNLTYTSIIAEISNSAQYLSLDSLKFIFEWGDELLRIKGQNAYPILKTWEAVCTSVLHTHETEEICNHGQFFLSLKEGLDPQDQRSVQNAFDFLLTLPSPHLVSQAFGLYRLWGHPYVCSRTGLRAIRMLGRAQKPINFETVQQLTWTFRKLFCRGYIAKHQTWPECKIHLHDQHPLMKYKTANLLPPEHLVPLHVWDSVELLKNFEADPTYNLASVISDKALSLTKTKLIESITKYHSIGRSEDRRVILSWLNCEFTTAKDLLQEINDEGFSPEELVIGVCPKEREMKTTPRLFALLTLKARMYFVLTEALLADHILPYFPQITMTDGALVLMKKLFGITKNQRYKTPNNVTIAMNIDFEKWNTNMRHEVVQPIFQEFDKLFGYTNLFQRTHPFFSDSWIYLADDSAQFDIREGDFVENDYAWKGHQGGLEGLRQKGWTLVTICAIALVASQEDIIHSLVGQGDNQVLTLTIRGIRRWLTVDKARYNQSILDKYIRFKERFFSTMKGIGLPVKKDETWESTCMFAYGKNLFLKGMPLCMSQKRICRMFAMANDQFPSLEAEISTIFGAGNAATQSDVDYYIPFILASTLACETFLINIQYSPLLGTSLLQYGKHPINSMPVLGWGLSGNDRLLKFVTKSSVTRWLHNDNLLYYFLWRPKILGGFPSQLLPTFLSRGFPDPVTEAGSQLRKMLPLVPDPLKALITHILTPTLSTEIREKMLLQDPVSLNLATPVSSGSRVKMFAEKFLQTTPFPNVQFTSFARLSGSSYEEVAKQLFALDPFHGFLMADVLEASLPGYAHTVIGKVMKTTTILDQTSSQSGSSMLMAVRRAELNWINYFFWEVNKTRNPVGEEIEACSVTWALKLRETGWNKQILGVTVPHPIEIFSLTWLSESGCPQCQVQEDKDHIKISFDPELVRNPNVILQHVGKNSPYLGSETKEKVTQTEGSTTYCVEPLLVRSTKLLRTIGWFIPVQSYAAQLLTNLSQSITDLEPELYFAVDEMTTGSEFHRYKSNRIQRGGLTSTQYSIASYLQISNNSLTKYAKSSINTTLHFQSAMVSLQQVVCSQLSRMTRVPYLSGAGVHCHISCSECVREIDDAPLQGDHNWPAIIFPSEPDNQYLWIPSSEIKKKFHPRENTVVYTKSLVHTGSLEITALNSLGRKMSRVLTSSNPIGVDSETSSIPMVWSAYLDPVSILEATLVHLLLYWIPIYLRIKSQRPEEQELERFLRSSLLTIPLVQFSPLSCLFIYPETRAFMLESEYRINPPLSIPLTVTSAHRATKESLMIILGNGFKCLLQKYVTSSYMLCSEIAHEPTYLVAHYVDLWLTSKISFKEMAQKEQGKAEWGPTYMIKVVEASLDALIKKVKRWEPDIRKSSLSIPNFSLPNGGTKKSLLPRVAGTLIKVGAWEKWNREKLPLTFDDLFASYFRQPSLETSSWFKYAAVLSTVGCLRPNSIAHLADGAGGNTAFSCLYFPKAKVLFNSLLSLEGILPQSLPGFSPPSIARLSSLYDLNLIPYELCDRISDITHPLFASSCLELNCHQPYDLIVADAEGGIWDSPSAIRDYVSSIYHICADQGTVIIKGYFSHKPSFYFFIDQLRWYWKRIQATRTVFSGKNEIHFVCQNKESISEGYPIRCDSTGVFGDINETVEQRLDWALQSTIQYEWEHDVTYVRSLQNLGTHLFKTSITSTKLLMACGSGFINWSHHKPFGRTDALILLDIIIQGVERIGHITWGEANAISSLLDTEKLNMPKLRSIVCLLGAILSMYTPLSMRKSALDFFYHQISVFVVKEGSEVYGVLSTSRLAPELKARRYKVFPSLDSPHSAKELVNTSGFLSYLGWTLGTTATAWNGQIVPCSTTRFANRADKLWIDPKGPLVYYRSIHSHLLMSAPGYFTVVYNPDVTKDVKAFVKRQTQIRKIPVNSAVEEKTVKDPVYSDYPSRPVPNFALILPDLSIEE